MNAGLTVVGGLSDTNAVRAADLGILAPSAHTASSSTAMADQVMFCFVTFFCLFAMHAQVLPSSHQIIKDLVDV